MDQLNSLKDNLKEIVGEILFPQAPKLISKSQQEFDVLQKLITKNHKQQLTIKTIKNIDLPHCKKIYVPTPLTKAIAEWYHKMLVHPRTSRLEATFRQVYWWSNLCKGVEICCTHCYVCELAKKRRNKDRKLPAKKVEDVNWDRANVDLALWTGYV